VPAFGCKFVPVMVTKVPTGALFGLKSLIVGPSGLVTMNAFAGLGATSVPVVIVTVRPPGVALPRIVMLTVA